MRLLIFMLLLTGSCFSQEEKHLRLRQHSSEQQTARDGVHEANSETNHQVRNYDVSYDSNQDETPPKFQYRYRVVASDSPIIPNEIQFSEADIKTDQSTSYSSTSNSPSSVSFSSAENSQIKNANTNGRNIKDDDIYVQNGNVYENPSTYNNFDSGGSNADVNHANNQVYNDHPNTNNYGLGNNNEGDHQRMKFSYVVETNHAPYMEKIQAAQSGQNSDYSENDKSVIQAVNNYDEEKDDNALYIIVNPVTTQNYVENSAPQFSRNYKDNKEANVHEDATSTGEYYSDGTATKFVHDVHTQNGKYSQTSQLSFQENESPSDNYEQANTFTDDSSKSANGNTYRSISDSDANGNLNSNYPIDDGLIHANINQDASELVGSSDNSGTYSSSTFAQNRNNADDKFKINYSDSGTSNSYDGSDERNVQFSYNVQNGETNYGVSSSTNIKKPSGYNDGVDAAYSSQTVNYNQEISAPGITGISDNGGNYDDSSSSYAQDRTYNSKANDKFNINYSDSGISNGYDGGDERNVKFDYRVQNGQANYGVSSSTNLKKPSGTNNGYNDAADAAYSSQTVNYNQEISAPGITGTSDNNGGYDSSSSYAQDRNFNSKANDKFNINYSDSGISNNNGGDERNVKFNYKVQSGEANYGASSSTSIRKPNKIKTSNDGDGIQSGISNYFINTGYTDNSNGNNANRYRGRTGENAAKEKNDDSSKTIGNRPSLNNVRNQVLHIGSRRPQNSGRSTEGTSNRQSNGGAKILNENSSLKKSNEKTSSDSSSYLHGRENAETFTDSQTGYNQDSTGGKSDESFHDSIEQQVKTDEDYGERSAIPVRGRSGENDQTQNSKNSNGNEGFETDKTQNGYSVFTNHGKNSHSFIKSNGGNKIINNFNNDAGVPQTHYSNNNENSQLNGRQLADGTYNQGFTNNGNFQSNDYSDESEGQQFLQTFSSSFNCRNLPGPGFYADVEAQCKVWHYCQLDGRQDTFTCPPGTLFNQVSFTCDWEHNVDCSRAPQLYHLNNDLYKSSNTFSNSYNVNVGK